MIMKVKQQVRIDLASLFEQ